MPRQYIITPELFDSTPHGFSQSVKVSGGATVYLSGQVGWDEHEALAGGRDFASQTRGAFENLQMAVQAAGGELRDVVSLRNYVINYRREEGGAISACLRDFFPPDALTATTWIGVHALARPELLIEIEPGAVLES